jgi:3-oxoadipate enol-lactonase
MHVTANGIGFHCQIDGPEGAPWLVFSNSLTTNVSMWDEQAAHFSRRFRVLRYDQRGHGQSDAPGGRYSFDLLMADAIAIMDAIGIARAHFCGLSMGGATAMGLAERHPDRLDHVIVCDAYCASTPESSKQWEERIATAQTHGMTALVESSISRWFPPETRERNPPHLARLRQMIAATPVNGFVGCAAALADHDFRSQAGAVKIPVLFLVGAKDGKTPAGMRELQAAVPGSQFVELPEAGHVSNLDKPELFNRAVDAFLSK